MTEMRLIHAKRRVPTAMATVLIAAIIPEVIIFLALTAQMIVGVVPLDYSVDRVH